MRPHFLMVLIALALPACRRPQPAVIAPAAAAVAIAPSSDSSCADVEFVVVPRQWPDPQWVDLSDAALLGGGWSSISTGRFGSASWEHCETFAMFGTDAISLPPQLQALAEVDDRQHCRVPDAVVAGNLVDFEWFREAMPEHDRDTAAERVGWPPSSQFGDTFYFDSLNLWRGDRWERFGFPKKGFYPGSSFVAIGDELVMSGGYAELSNGERRSVAQSAVFRAATGEWSYTEPMHRPRRDHVLLRSESGALALGGTDDGGAVAPIEAYDPKRASWRVLQVGPPLEHLVATWWGEDVFVVERNEPDAAISRAARITPGKRWTWISAPAGLVDVHRAATLIGHATGPILVTPSGIERYDTRRDQWTTCDVSRELDRYPIAGKGDGSWGPAHATADGRVFVTRIDRERYYDFDE